jgi:hypothetical protein
MKHSRVSLEPLTLPESFSGKNVFRTGLGCKTNTAFSVTDTTFFRGFFSRLHGKKHLHLLLVDVDVFVQEQAEDDAVRLKKTSC